MSSTDSRREYRITELEQISLPQDCVTSNDREQLARLEAKGLVSLTATRDRWILHAESVVGVLNLDRVTITIEPKLLIDGERLMTWLMYALHIQPEHVPAQRRWQVDTWGLPDLVSAALERECRRLVRTGLRRDYRRREQTDTVLRGQLDVRRQATRRFGMVDELHLRTFDRDMAVWENLVCGVALDRAARVSQDAALTRSVREVAGYFPRDPAFGVRAATQRLRNRQYHRMNRHYRPAHTWSSLLLNTGGPSDLLVDAGRTASSLLLNTYRLWESVVRRLVSQAIVGSAGTVVETTGIRAVSITERGKPRNLEVDVLAEWKTPDGGTWLPVDAKYKTYGTKSLSSNDIHQLLTYATAYSGQRAVVLHPSTAGTTRREVTTSGPHGLIGRFEVLGVDVSRSPEDCVADLAIQLHT